jgi:nucleoside-diphosphate-sugar epimerase
MKILVIGNGFLAAQIVAKLESEGHEILIFSRRRNLGIQIKQVMGDIFDFNNFVKVLDWEPQIVINTAWITTPNLYRSDSLNYQYADFTTKLAESLLGSKVEHLIVLGTCAEYAQRINSNFQGIEVSSLSTLYAEQKIRALNSVNKILESSEIRFTWARVFFPYGPGQHPLRLIPTLLSSLKTGEPITLSDTSSVNDWITSRDVASAISWIVRHELIAEIDVGTSIGFTNLEILTNIERLLGMNHNQVAEKVHNFGGNQKLVASKDSSLFGTGWTPNDSLVSGLEWVLGS